MSRPHAGDALARSHAVQDDGSVLVQAPAGSGKTTLLTQRYLRLLASVDAPERILALTFTRRAAEEMRERVIVALAAAAHADRPPGFNADTWQLAVAARGHLESLKIDVQRQSSRLRIETIDSFNFWLAGQLPIAAGAGGRLNVMEDARAAYEEAARRALAHEAADHFAEAVERTLAVGDQRWRQLVALIGGMLPDRDRWLPLLAGRVQAASALDTAQLDRIRRHFDEDLALLVTRRLQAANEALGAEAVASLAPLLHGAARRIAADRPEVAAWLVPGMLSADASDLERWRATAGMVLTKAGELRKRFGNAEGFAPQSRSEKRCSIWPSDSSGGRAPRPRSTAFAICRSRPTATRIGCETVKRGVRKHTRRLRRPRRPGRTIENRDGRARGAMLNLGELDDAAVGPIDRGEQQIAGLDLGHIEGVDGNQVGAGDEARRQLAAPVAIRTHGVNMDAMFTVSNPLLRSARGPSQRSQSR